MADENELRELCERIGQLEEKDQVRLLEMVLADNRRRRDEQIAQNLAADAALRAAEKRELATWEEWHLKRSEGQSKA
jgi:hypothetical protein